MKIYVAYRYSADNVLDVLSNIGRAIHVGTLIARKGHYPYIPHLDCFIAMFDGSYLDGREIPLEYYYKSSLEWLKVCDAIYIVDELDIRDSKGVAREFEYCMETSKPVYFYLTQLPEVK